jgi:hypothetical protein
MHGLRVDADTRQLETIQRLIARHLATIDMKDVCMYTSKRKMFSLPAAVAVASGGILVLVSCVAVCNNEEKGGKSREG